MKKKLLGCILVIGCVFATFLSGCDIYHLGTNFANSSIWEHVDWDKVFPPRKEYEKGDFKYCYTGNDGVLILDLTDEGYKKDIIIIPEEIDGKPVVAMGEEGFMWDTEIGGSTTKIYLPKTIQQIKGIVRSNMFLIDEVDENFFIKLNSSKFRESLYVSKSVYEKIYNVAYYPTLANVEFFVDGETYWIDNCDNNSLIQEPEKPFKEGYEFIGWFKEPECINQWDFEQDFAQEKESLGGGKFITNCLYAKWQEV